MNDVNGEPSASSRAQPPRTAAKEKAVAEADGGRWFLLPFPTILKSENSIVWHYTDANGLLGILSTNALFASSTTALNDSQELTYGEDVIRRAWEGFKQTEQVPEPCRQFVDKVLESALFDSSISAYALSASLDGDSLNQWQHYGTSAGFAVGLQSAERLTGGRRLVAGSSSGAAYYEKLMTLGWNRVLYDPTEQLELAARFFPLIMNGTPGSPVTWQETEYLSAWPEAAEKERVLLRSLACFFKNPAFAAEKEARYITEISASMGGPEFRVSGGRLVPFARLQHPAKRLPIVEVVIGPTADGQAHAHVQALLTAMGYPDTSLRPSAVPLRRS